MIKHYKLWKDNKLRGWEKSKRVGAFYFGSDWTKCTLQAKKPGTSIFHFLLHLITRPKIKVTQLDVDNLGFDNDKMMTRRN